MSGNTDQPLLTGVLVFAGSMVVTCVGSAKGKPSKILSTLIELG